MIKRNRAQCLKCKQIIESKNRHDFVWCECKSIAVDGGKDYLKRVGALSDCKELSTFTKEENDGR